MDSMVFQQGSYFREGFCSNFRENVRPRQASKTTNPIRVTGLCGVPQSGHRRASLRPASPPREQVAVTPVAT